MTPVDGEWYLQCLSQIGLGFAGFSTVIISLRQAGEAHWSDLERYALKFILSHSFGLVLLALFPFVPAFFDCTEITIWRSSSFCMGVFLVAEVCLQARRIINVRGTVVWSVKPLLIFYIVPTTLIGLGSIRSALRGDQWSKPLFATCLLYILLQAGIQFSLSLSKYMNRPAE